MPNVQSPSGPPSGPGRGPRGFTLVELLVVIGIIAVLIGLLMPVLRSAREQGRRAVCTSNLRQLSQAVILHAAENDRQLPQSVSQWGGRYGLLIRQKSGFSPYSGLKDEISLSLFQKYTGSVDINNPIVADRYTGIMWCPSNGTPGEFEDYKFGDGLGALTHHWTNFDYTFFTYSYFGRVDQFEAWVTRPQDLTGKQLAADKLLFADATYNGGAPGVSHAWLFNHGRNGAGGFVYKPITDLAGTNNAYGDGHVEWKPGSAFNLQRMASYQWDPSIGMMNGNPNMTYW